MACMQAGRQAGRHACMYADRQTDRQTKRQTDTTHCLNTPHHTAPYHTIPPDRAMLCCTLPHRSLPYQPVLRLSFRTKIVHTKRLWVRFPGGIPHEVGNFTPRR